MLYPKLDYNPDDPLPGLDPPNNGIDRYLSIETRSMPSPGYLQLQSAEAWRERAIVVIFNVAKLENLEPLIPYLAMNYYDRCISGENPVPVVMKSRENDRELLCVCCLIMAWKIRNKHFSASEFLGRHSELAVIDPEKFHAMDLYILKELDWRLRSVTGLCFVQFFAPEFDCAYGFRRRTIDQIIMNSQNDIKNTRFRPSVMAAAAFLSASSFLYRGHFQIFVERMASKEIFRGGELWECVRALIQQCKELNTLIESVVVKNEYRPRLKVRAGEIQLEEEEEEEIARSIDNAGTSKGKQAAPEPSGSSGQASGGELNPEEADSAKLAGEEAERRRKGKGKVSEAERTGIPAATEDFQAATEDFPATFTLRWRLGETNVDEFKIFTAVSGRRGQLRRRLSKLCCGFAQP